MAYREQVDLATDQVTGTLPISHGGTNITTYTTGDILYASAANVLSKLPIGTTGQVLVVQGGIPSWQPASAVGGTVTTVTVFTGNGTWTKATGSTQMLVFVINGGGGGGGGRRGASTAAGGGAGGALGGGVIYQGPSGFFNSTESVTVGGGGNGGATQTVDNTNGNPGSIGGVSSFGSYLSLVTTGSAGAGGTTTSAVAGVGPQPLFAATFFSTSVASGPYYSYPIVSVAGTVRDATAGAQVASTSVTSNAFTTSLSIFGTSGAGGSGGDSVTARQAGNGGSVTGLNGNLITGGAGGIETGTVNGGNGAQYNIVGGMLFGGAGGGGGGGMRSIGPGTGGTGGLGGAGGGGGGGSINGTNSGPGGNGGAGLVIVYEWSNFGQLI